MPSSILDFAREKGCTITKTFETHRQADYISGSDLMRRTAGVEIVAPDDDFKVAKFPYTSARHGETHRLNGGPKVDVIHTPGHTPGSTCYSIDGKYLVTGDTVFHRIYRSTLILVVWLRNGRLCFLKR
jgi:glyoxylase-like metal-dependent hydrolase (beta-lactamase superfamily II)